MLQDGTDLYDTPELYDLEYWGYRGDLPFYLEVSRRVRPKPLLDFGCGTGRLTLALAHAGFRVCGVELAPFMLSLCRQRLAQTVPEVAARVQLGRGNICSYRGEKQRFGAVLVAFNTLQHLDPSGLVSALQTVRFHLAPGGLLAFDCYAPVQPEQAQQDRDFTDLQRRERPRGQGYVLVDQRVRYDVASSVLGTQYRFRTYSAAGGLTGQHVKNLYQYQWQQQQLEQMLQQAGLTIVEHYGDVDFSRPRENSPRMMMVARQS